MSTTTAAPKRACIYRRISLDRSGAELGVGDQAADCRELAARRGYTVVADYEDNDISAFSGKKRDRYLAMLDGIRRHDFDVIIATHPDRLHRSLIELEKFIPLLETSGVTVETVRDGLYDLSTSSGRLSARVVGAVAVNESETKRDRVKRAMKRNAEAGAPHGRKSYGWRRVHTADPNNPNHIIKQDVINPDEADIIRDIATRIIGGSSLSKLEEDLKAREVPSPTAGSNRPRPWTRNTIRTLMLREAGNDGSRTGGVTILTAEVAGNVKRILKDPNRRTATDSNAAHLLSGIATCGVCGDRLWVGRVRSGAPVYRCQTGHLGRRKEDVEAWVEAVIVERLSRPDAADLFVKPENLDDRRKAQDEAAAIQRELERAREAMKRGALGVDDMIAINEAKRPLLEDAQRRAAVVDDRPALAPLLGADDVRAAWKAMSLESQRTVVSLLMDVKVLPGRKGVHSFDPSTVEISWK